MPVPYWYEYSFEESKAVCEIVFRIVLFGAGYRYIGTLFMASRKHRNKTVAIQYLLYSCLDIYTQAHTHTSTFVQIDKWTVLDPRTSKKNFSARNWKGLLNILKSFSRGDFQTQERIPLVIFMRKREYGRYSLKILS